LEDILEEPNNEHNNYLNDQSNKIIDKIGMNNNEKNDNNKDNKNLENKNDNNNSLGNQQDNNVLENKNDNNKNNLEKNEDNQNKIVIIPDNKNNSNNNAKIIDIMDNSIISNNVPAPLNFSFERFSSDFTNLLNLYSDSRNNFRISEDLETENLKSNKSINEIVLNKTKENIISPRRLYILIERDFGLDNSSRDATSDEKIVLKLFYISYVCNELIGILCNKANQKSFQYTSIYNFYYTVSLSYNSAINGFKEIANEMKQKEKELKEYSKFKKSNNSEAPPAVYD